MASTYITRNPEYPASNTAAPNSASMGPRKFQFYEKTYASATSEAIYLPDACFPTGIGFSWTSGTYALNVTFSPPDVIEAGNAAWIPTTITSGAASAYLNVQGPTAIQIITTGGTTKVSIRA